MLYHSKYEALSDAFIVQNFLDFKGFIRKKEIWKKDSSWNLELSFSFMLLLIFWGFFFEIQKCLKVSKFLNQKLLKLINLKSRKFLKWYDSKNKSLLQSYLLKKKEFWLYIFSFVCYFNLFSFLMLYIYTSEYIWFLHFFLWKCTWQMTLCCIPVPFSFFSF